ncbi:MAG TPA: DUF222 domain-containing protein [Cellulomonas sp.]
MAHRSMRPVGTTTGEPDLAWSPDSGLTSLVETLLRQACPPGRSDDADDPRDDASASASEDRPPLADLGAVPVGPDLASVLAGVDPGAVTDAELADLVAAAIRVQGWAHAAAARFAAELSDRDSMHPTWSEAAGGAPTPPCVTGDELAMRLAWSRRSATRLVRHGRAFRQVLSDTGDALADGRIDQAAAQLIADRLIDLPAETALAVQSRVLDGADRRTPTQLRRDVERALIAVDAEEAARRRAHARTGRRVDRPRVLPDGMAGLWAVLPAPDATRIDATLDAAARTARSVGDPRTLDQLRADGLRDLVLHTACAAGTAQATGTALPSAVPSERAATPDGTAHPDVTAPRTIEATDPLQAAGADPRVSDGCQAVPRPRARVRVTVALSTLLGMDDQPADLAGYGPIDAVAARALAEGGIWRRVVTDPLSGTVLDVGRTRYRPHVGLVRHVKARDGTCARPGCSADAEACDLDHTVEFHAAPGTRTDDAPPGTCAVGAPGTGTTAAHNLGPLCRRDHRLKTDGGSRLRQVAPGRYEWVSPTGHRYLVVPGDDGRNVHLGSGPPDLGPPPF